MFVFLELNDFKTVRNLFLAVFSFTIFEVYSIFIRLNSCFFGFFVVECAQVIRKANFKMSKQLIYSGKAKDIYTTEDEKSYYFNLQGPGDCF